MAVRVTQEVFEVIVSANPSARVSQYVVEVLYTTNPTARISQYVVDVLYTSSPTARLSQYVVEVLRSTADALESELTLAQTLSLQWTHNESLTSTISFTQTTVRQIGATVESTLSLAHSNSLQFLDVELISQTITFGQTATASIVQPQEVESVLALVSTVSLTWIDVESITTSIPLDHWNFLQVIHFRDLTSTLSLTQQVAKRFDLSQSLTFSDTINEYEIKEREIEHALEFEQEVSRTVEFTFDLESVLEFNVHRRTIPINGYLLAVPEVLYSLVPRRCRVVLSVPAISIILPCPLFGDSIANSSKIALKRTMTGGLYTYSKKSELEKIKYDFLISTKKGRELRVFLQNYMSDLVTMENWKGESWLVNIINDPVEEITKGLARPTDESLNITLEFEGVKING